MFIATVVPLLGPGLDIVEGVFAGSSADIEAGLVSFERHCPGFIGCSADIEGVFAGTAIGCSADIEEEESAGTAVGNSADIGEGFAGTAASTGEALVIGILVVGEEPVLGTAGIPAIVEEELVGSSVGIPAAIGEELAGSSVDIRAGECSAGIEEGHSAGIGEGHFVGSLGDWDRSWYLLSSGKERRGRR